MDKKAFFERYSKIFGTSTFKETKAKWDSLTKEERLAWTKSFRSASMKKHYENPANRAGRKQTDEEKEKRSKSLKQFYLNHPGFMNEVAEKTGFRKRQAASLKKYFENPDNRIKQSESLKEAYQKDPSYRQRVSSSLRDYWGLYKATPEGQEAIESFINAPRGKGKSQIEQSIQDFVATLVNDAIFNDKSTLSGKELDVFVPSKKVAIEIDGLVWHCSKFKKDYPVQLSAKTDLCEQSGIRLIHFYDDEIRFKLPIVKSIISAALGKYQKKIYARKCVLKEVDRKTGDEFFEKNHLSGTARASEYIGLFYNDELVQCASFGKNRFTKEKRCELIRMASLLNTQVVGGFSKIMSTVDECESYVDRRIYNGSGYLASGWTLVEKTKNGYYYTDFNKRYPRQMFMKCKLLKKWPDADLSLREEDICKSHGFYQIFNCGNYKLLWKKLTN